MKKILILTVASLSCIMTVVGAITITRTQVYEVRVTTKTYSCSRTNVFTVEASNQTEARNKAITAARSQTQTIVNRVTLKR